MIKKVLLSLAMFGFVFGSPILASAQSFTNLKAQLFDLSTKIENFKKVEKGEVLGVTSDVTVSLSPYFDTTVPSGGSVTISWVVNNAVSCEASGKWSGSKNPNGGSETISNITEGGYWHLECFDSNGNKAHDAIRIQIAEKIPKITFTANPSKIPSGGSTTLSWKVENPTNDTKCDQVGISYSNNNDEGKTWYIPADKGMQGSQTISNLKSGTGFYLTCKNFEGYSRAEVYVDVSVAPQINFKATPSVVSYLGSTKLEWNNANANSCKGEGDWSGYKVNGGGSQIISGIKTDKTFILTCSGYYGGSYSKSVKVKVLKLDDKDKTDYPGPKDDPNKDDDTQRVGTNTGTSSNICSFVFTKDLAYGSTDSVKNKDVSLMQSVLVDEGFLSSRDASGKFYSVTQSALKKFQKKYGLSQTGKVDQKTRVKLNELFPIYCNQ